MKRLELTILFLAGLTTAVTPQSNSNRNKPLPTRSPELEIGAVVNRRKFALTESAYAMNHPNEGFACDPQVLTKLEWPDSPSHSKLLDSTLLDGAGQYKFSAQCEETSKPVGKLSVLAVPLDPNANLRTFCATGAFRSSGTSEFPIRSISGGAPERWALHQGSF